MKTLICLLLLTSPFLSQAADFCVTGLRGTATSNYIFKVSQATNSDRMVGLLDANKNPIFQTKAENHFTQFNSTGYGVCSVTASGTDEQTGARIKLELKVAPHAKAACNKITIPTSVEYVTLKITPKGTTLGDDLTAYALTIIPCP